LADLTFEALARPTASLCDSTPPGLLFPSFASRAVFDPLAQGGNDVNCPKCGYSQEERSDCKRCGIVFAKYFALRKTADSQEPGAPAAPENGSTEIAEMQRALRELARKYGEVEFERSERQRLREEIRAVEHRFEGELTGLSARISEIEKSISEILTVAQIAPQEFARLERSFANRFDPFLKKLETIESRIEALSKEARNDSRFMDSVRRLDQRVADTETLVAKVASEPKPANGAADIAELRSALQMVTLRYSEIGDLKKNHLVLLNKLETLQHEFDAAKNGGNKAISDKVREMEIEVPALRAELRQVLKHLEALDAAPQSTGDAVVSIKGEMDGVMKAVSDLGSEVALLRAELSQVEDNIAPPPMEPEPLEAGPLENDVRAIRQDMKEIRSFIYSLTQKQ
jgi:DNA repair exonuclease SbcCD ATPase subunit